MITNPTAPNPKDTEMHLNEFTRVLDKAYRVMHQENANANLITETIRELLYAAGNALPYVSREGTMDRLNWRWDRKAMAFVAYWERGSRYIVVKQKDDEYVVSVPGMERESFKSCEDACRRAENLVAWDRASS